MSRVLRSVRKRKKGRTLGAVDVIDREGYAELEVDAKVELIRSLIPLGLLHIEELLDEEVTALAGERDARKDPSVGGRRHGSNPGTVGLAGQRVPIRVPRIRHVTEREIPLRSYEALHGDRAVNDLLLRRVLYGISCRNYAAAAEAIPGAIGLSGSTVSRAFIQASATKLRELQERDLSGEDVVALVLDGKTFAEATMVVALGITMTGDKRFLGFVETDTENEQVLTPFLRSLVERGLDVSQGLLVIVDGGKGLRAAGRKAFRHRALVQRCQWHKRENVVSDLAKREQPVWRQRLQRAYNRPEYDEALAALELDPISWTRSERWIRCPEWQQPHVGGHAGNSVTSSGLGRSGWCWKRGRRSAPSPASWILPNRPCGNGSSGRAPTAAGAVPV